MAYDGGMNLVIIRDCDSCGREFEERGYQIECPRCEGHELTRLRDLQKELDASKARMAERYRKHRALVAARKKDHG